MVGVTVLVRLVVVQVMVELTMVARVRIERVLDELTVVIHGITESPQTLSASVDIVGES